MATAPIVQRHLQLQQWEMAIKNARILLVVDLIKGVALARHRRLFREGLWTGCPGWPLERGGVGWVRVAKCHRYGRYIYVKISKSWGIKFVGIQNRYFFGHTLTTTVEFFFKTAFKIHFCYFFPKICFLCLFNTLNVKNFLQFTRFSLG